LDHQHRARVPETYLLNSVRHKHWTGSNGQPVSKTGSVQAFVPNSGDTSELGASLFSVDDVHNVGIFDVRLFNMDRNGENLLAVPSGNKNLQLVPIDHAYILPPTLDNAYFEWLSWKQAKVPFSALTLDYIAQLDVSADARTLSDLGIPEECIRTMKLSTTLLKKGAAAGLTLYEIASMVSRKMSQQSELEKIVGDAEKAGGEFFVEFERRVETAVTSKRGAISSN